MWGTAASRRGGGIGIVEETANGHWQGGRDQPLGERGGMTGEGKWWAKYENGDGGERESSEVRKCEPGKALFGMSGSLPASTRCNLESIMAHSTY